MEKQAQEALQRQLEKIALSPMLRRGAASAASAGSSAAETLKDFLTKGVKRVKKLPRWAKNTGMVGGGALAGGLLGSAAASREEERY